MKIVYLSDEPRNDDVNHQFLTSATEMRENFGVDSRFLFFSSKSCKENNIIGKLNENRLENFVLEAECGCRKNISKIENFVLDMMQDFNADVLQIGWMLKYFPVVISENWKTIGLFFSERQKQIFVQNKDVLSNMPNIITYDVIHLKENDILPDFNFRCIGNTIETKYFLNSNFSQIELTNHIRKYYEFYENCLRV